MNLKINFRIEELEILMFNNKLQIHPREHIKKIFNNYLKKGLIGVRKIMQIRCYAQIVKMLLRSCGAGIAAVMI